MNLFSALLGPGMQQKILAQVGKMMKEKGARYALVSIDDQGNFDANFITDDLVIIPKADLEKMKNEYFTLRQKLENDGE